MRAVLGAIAVAVCVCFAAGSAGATQSTPTNATVIAPKAKATVLAARRCRCVERRWNGSCKLRVCRDHW